MPARQGTGALAYGKTIGGAISGHRGEPSRRSGAAVPSVTTVAWAMGGWRRVRVSFQRAGLSLDRVTGCAGATARCRIG